MGKEMSEDFLVRPSDHQRSDQSGAGGVTPEAFPPGGSGGRRDWLWEPRNRCLRVHVSGRKAFWLNAWYVSIETSAHSLFYPLIFINVHNGTIIAWEEKYCFAVSHSQTQTLFLKSAISIVCVCVFQGVLPVWGRDQRLEGSAGRHHLDHWHIRAHEVLQWREPRAPAYSVCAGRLQTAEEARPVPCCQHLCPPLLVWTQHWQGRRGGWCGSNGWLKGTFHPIMKI